MEGLPNLYAGFIANNNKTVTNMFGGVLSLQGKGNITVFPFPSGLLSLTWQPVRYAYRLLNIMRGEFDNDQNYGMRRLW